MALGRGLFVFVDHRGLECGDFAVEAVLVPGPLGLLLRDQAEVVEVGAGDTAALGDPLGRSELIGHVQIPRLGPDLGAVRSGIRAQADPAHRLDSAGDTDIDRPGGDQAGNQMICLLGATALAVDRGGADLFGETGGQPGDPGDVIGLLAVLRHATADHLLDGCGIDSGLVDQSLLHPTQNFRRVQSGKPATALSDRASGGFDDHRITHAVRLEHVSLP